MKMSQQKFASNVVEKCLTFGGPAERQLLVNEMLGSSDENAPLQVFEISHLSNSAVDHNYDWEPIIVFYHGQSEEGTTGSEISKVALLPVLSKRVFRFTPQK